MIERREHPAGCARVTSGGIRLAVTERILDDIDAAATFMNMSGE
ncbi:MAG: hypothetical protein OXG98_04755 [Gemmatimonadetes bacterium]|nr:hypothetical protein [Gemmatimonadota bacterium]